MTKCRVQLSIFMVGMFAVGGMFVFAPSRSIPSAVAADAMLASDAATWKTLVSPKDLSGMLEIQTAEIDKAMKSKATFQRGFRKMELVGYLVAALGNIGTVTLEGEDAQKAAALREAGLKLASSAKEKNYDEAKAAADIVTSYPSKISPASDATPAKFTDVLPLGILMKGVSSIDSSMGAAIRKEDKFKSEAKEQAFDSTLMAVLAVVARDHNENEDWKVWCDEMREASVALGGQFQKRNLDGAKEARGALQKSCADCHDVYRKEE